LRTTGRFLQRQPLKCGTHVSDEDLEEVAEVSGILEHTNYLHPQFHAECERIFPEGKEILPNEAPLAFRFLKQNIDGHSSLVDA
jgi:hypothetical protein